MHKKFSLTLIIVLLTICGCSKFYYQPPLAKFNHENHVEILFKQRQDCTYCHKLPAIDSLIQQGYDLNITPEVKIPDLHVTPELNLDSRCHACHKDKATKVAKAPQRCSTCHETMKTMKPDDHVANWTKMHSVPASLAKSECEKCHRDWYCETCHSQQQSLKSDMHPRIFKLKHSLEAMVDPGSCGTCHQVSFCIDCHLKD